MRRGDKIRRDDKILSRYTAAVLPLGGVKKCPLEWRSRAQCQ
jgi:hypothetical protein